MSKVFHWCVAQFLMSLILLFNPVVSLAQTFNDGDSCVGYEMGAWQQKSDTAGTYTGLICNGTVWRNSIQFNSGGRVYIGSYTNALIDEPLVINRLDTGTASGGYNATTSYRSVAPTANQAAGRKGTALLGYTDVPSANTRSIQEVRGTYGGVDLLGSGTVAKASGVMAYAGSTTTATTAKSSALDAYSWTGSGTVTQANGALVVVDVANASTVTSASGVRVEFNRYSTPTITNRYGVLLKTPVGGAATNDWGFYQEGTQNNYFAGKLSIGGTGVPAATLNVAGEVKLGNTGASCAVGIAGAMRYNASLNIIEYCNGSAWKIPSGSMVLISTQTASNSTALQWTGLGSAYNTYRLHCADVVPATNGALFQLQFGQGATPTWQTSNYRWHNDTNTHSAVGFDTTGNGATDGIDLDATIDGLPSSTTYKQVRYIVSNYTAGEFFLYTGGGVYIGDTTAVTAIRVVESSGNIASGSCSLYGIAP